MTETISSVQTSPTFRYASFWIRVGAAILDSIIIGIPTVAVTMVNVSNWKSPAIYVIITLLAFVYKPYFEYKYSATWGKMLTGIKVIRTRFQTLTLKSASLRNIVQVINTVVSIAVTLPLFYRPEFEYIDSYNEYNQFLAQSGALMPVFIIGVLSLLDVAFMWFDKRYQTLHDRIAGTFVIEANVNFADGKANTPEAT